MKRFIVDALGGIVFATAVPAYVDVVIRLQGGYGLAYEAFYFLSFTMFLTGMWITDRKYGKHHKAK